MAPRTVQSIDDSQNALRLLQPAWIKEDGTITSAAFYARKNKPSLFIRELLPNEDGDVLHIDKFKNYGRGRLSVGHLRSARSPDGFDLQLTGSADPPLEEFGDAHAELLGPVGNKTAARRLATAFNTQGDLERRPVRAGRP